MILVDDALARRAGEGRPVRVGLVGAGFMGRGVVWQLRHAVPGMQLVAIANRTPAKAEAAVLAAGYPKPRPLRGLGDVAACAADGVPGVTDDPMLVCDASEVDVLIEATGAVEFGARVVMRAIEQGRDVVSMNVELDATVGPIVQAHARENDVIVTGADGDQPAVQANLVRFVRSLGLTPMVCGNIKGLQDHYRTPETQKGFAAQWGQTPEMVTSFADGTKISMEQALLANALGMTVAVPGMLGPEHHGHVDDLRTYYEDAVGIGRLREMGGIVDYVVGAKPSPGVFVLAVNDHPEREVYLRYGKLGDGPLYSFYVPYHLTALEVHLSAARVALFRDQVVTPRHEAPRVEVVAHAKRDLSEGETLDGLGGFLTYGACERADVAAERRMLPIGIAEGSRLRQGVPRDRVIGYDDVEVPEDRLVVRLRREQDARFGARP